MSITYWIEGDGVGWYTTWSFDNIKSENDQETYEPHDTRLEAMRHARLEARALSVAHDMDVVVRISGTRSDKGKPPQLLHVYGPTVESVKLF